LIPINTGQKQKLDFNVTGDWNSVKGSGFQFNLLLLCDSFALKLAEETVTFGGEQQNT
jgi:hypothetical protein